ncbi:MAG TPA: mannonate dehydratase, partial [Deltaproteobacteria bacterium]|nr:mannonate dehydratase [Deltaproteobacteria bacterium]
MITRGIRAAVAAFFLVLVPWGLMAQAPLNAKKSMALPRLVGQVSSKTTDDELKMLKQMAIDDVELSFANDEMSYEAAAPIVARLRNFPNGGFTITLGSNGGLQKNASIILGKSDRDAQIETFKSFIVVLGRLGIPVTVIAWQPNGIVRTKGLVNQHTRGGGSAIADMAEIAKMPVANDGVVYSRDQMWASFKYFIDAVLPTCERAKVALALHPNDPPVPSLLGAASLIYSSDDYRRAFALAKNSPYLGMKMCVGCWLEGGVAFGDILKDIDEFAKAGKILNVHFRNVSNPLNPDYTGYFEETLCQDGYADMYAIM